ncbi:IS66 family transposase zinc-finger binding domain-containing protein [Robinsoniella sp. KNHs210]|uniref:IS66 family transposase zinc-finger binding domain-containing protein n=1 Tax=Robinsoniella sp. KNHs210 TaxID=1469950 RepID=UPI000485CDF8
MLVKEEVIELTEAEQSCIKCNALLERIGKEFVCQEFRFTPARGTLVKIYRATYKCPECSTSNTLATNIQFVKAHVPGVLIPPQLCISFCCCLGHILFVNANDYRIPGACSLKHNTQAVHQIRRRLAVLGPACFLSCRGR